MIFLFEYVPLNTSPEDALLCKFGKHKTPITLYATVEKLQRGLNAFYAFFSRLSSDKNFQPTLPQILEQKEYLRQSLDLMEYGVRATYPLTMAYQSFLEPKREILANFELRSCLAVEFLMARMTFAIGTSRFLKKNIQTHVQSAFGAEKSFNQEQFSSIIESFRVAVVRLAKLNKGKNELWKLISPDAQANPEFRIGTFEIVYKVFEVSLANCYIYKNMMLISSKNTEAELRSLQTIAKCTIKRIAEVSYLLKNFTFYKELDLLKNFLDNFSLFHNAVLDFLILKENKLIETAITENSVVEGYSLPQIYYENHIVACNLLQTEEKISSAKVTTPNKLFIDFVSQFYELTIKSDKPLIKFAKKTFEQMKDDVLSKISKKSTYEDIRGRISDKDIVGDQIEQLCQED